MEIKFCDTCGKKTEKVYGVQVPIGAEQIKRAGMSDYVQWIDGKMQPVMGRSDTVDVCIDCLVKIETNNISFLDKLKEENKDRLAEVKLIISGEL